MTQNLESILETYYQQQESCYERMLKIAKTLASALTSSQDYDVQLQKMQTVMLEIEKRDRDNHENRNSWEQLGSPAGPILKLVVQRVRTLMTEVMTHVETAENAAKKAKAALTPQMATSTQRRQMQAAYNTHTET